MVLCFKCVNFHTFLLLYRNVIDFCMFILHSQILLNSLIFKIDKRIFIKINDIGNKEEEAKVRGITTMIKKQMI